MSPPRSLQISAAGADQALSPQQKRFNTLVRQIEQARTALAAWQAGISAYQQAYAGEVLPLFDQVAAARRKWVFTLDAMFDRPGWSRGEVATLSQLIHLMARDLLQRDAADAALRALFARHRAVDFDTHRQRDLAATLEMMERVTGVEIGDAGEIRSDDDLVELLHRKLLAEEQAREQTEAAGQARREAQGERRRRDLAEQRREAKARQTTQSVREIFRKLASALHPDRETDARKREAKTALMQQVNQAYAANDLLTLLQLQLQIEQVDVRHIAGASAEKMQHYNEVLAGQLAQLKQELQRVETGFCIDFGVRSQAPLAPSRLPALLKLNKRQLRDELEYLQDELRMLANRAAARRWLKHQRQLLGEMQAPDPGFD